VGHFGTLSLGGNFSRLYTRPDVALPAIYHWH